MRLLLAIVIAVGMHLALFSLHMPWAQPVPKAPAPRAVTLSLVHLPAPAAPKPQVKPLPLPAAGPIAPLAAKKLPRPKQPPAPKPKKKIVTAPEPAEKPDPPPTSEAEEQTMDPLPDVDASETHQAIPDAPAEMSAVSSRETAPLSLSYPLYDANPPMTYPTLARRRNYQGTVILDVLVSPRGRAREVKVHTSSGYKILDRHAAESVHTWRFEPARRGPQAVEMWVQVPIKFELR